MAPRVNDSGASRRDCQLGCGIGLAEGRRKARTEKAPATNPNVTARYLFMRNLLSASLLKSRAALKQSIAPRNPLGNRWVDVPKRRPGAGDNMLGVKTTGVAE